MAGPAWTRWAFALLFAELDVAITMREQNLGPLRLTISRDGTGSYRASGQLPVAGSSR